MKHTGLLLSNRIDRQRLIEELLTRTKHEAFAALSTLKGLLFSNLAIEKMIATEQRLQQAMVGERYLHSYSSGERKNIFLDYLIQQNPGYLVLDAVFDHLDPQSKALLSQKIQDCSRHIKLIQIESRAQNFLPLLETRLCVEDNSFLFRTLEERSDTIATPISSLPKLKSSFRLEGKEMLRFGGVSVQYDGRPIVSNIHWTILQGDFWQLVGPNGSGKSTLLSLVTGDNPKGYGQELYIFGRKRGTGESVREIKKHIGYYSPVLAEMFWRFQSLEQMILSGFYDSVGLYVKPTSIHKKIVREWLKALDLLSLANTPYTQLSLGLQRITLIIRAFVKQPPLLILDEPLEGLDEEGVALVCNLINRLVAETNTTIIYVSHQVEERIKPKEVYALSPSEEGSSGRKTSVNL